MKPPLKNKRKRNLAPPEVVYFLAEDLNNKLDKAFDLLFEEVARKKQGQKPLKKLSTSAIAPMYN